MAFNLIQSQNEDGSFTEGIYRPPINNAHGRGNSPDIVAQQNGVPFWIQKALGIDAANMSPEDLAKLNETYSVNRTRDGRFDNRVLTDQSGKVLGRNSYYDAPFSVVKDFLLPAATVWGGGFLGANALFGGAAGGAAAGGAAGGASGASGATNAALIDSALGTAGYGASSAGVGGAVAGAGAAAADPISAYLTTGATEGSTIGNAITGAGGASGAVGSGTVASGLQGLGGLFGGGNPLGTLNTARQLGGLLGGALGGVAGGSGGETYNGPMPTITRGGWQSSVTPQYMSLMGDAAMPKKKGAANSGLWQFLGA